MRPLRFKMLNSSSLSMLRNSSSPLEAVHQFPTYLPSATRLEMSPTLSPSATRDPAPVEICKLMVNIRWCGAAEPRLQEDQSLKMVLENSGEVDRAE